MGKTQDPNPANVTSTTRRGAPLSTKVAYYSLTVLRQLVTPPPPALTNEPHSIMSHITDDTSDAIIDTATATIESSPIGELFDNYLAILKEMEHSMIYHVLN